MLGVLFATQQQAVTPDAAARPDAVAVLPMCHRSLGNVDAWTEARGGIATTGFTAKRSTRRLRRCPT
jgi:hypothetical protein